MSFPTPSDLSGTISHLFVYPIKSCAGVARTQAVLTETGLEWDRNWMVVDKQGMFLSQRELPRMALIVPQIKAYEMVLRAPGMLALHVALDAVEQPCRVTVWDDEVAAYDMGDIAAQWLTDFLGTAGGAHGPVRLVRFDPEHRRLSSQKWTQGALALNQFSDSYPILVLSQASIDALNARLASSGYAPVGIERFRPNIVLSHFQAHDEDRCARLVIDTTPTWTELALVKPCSRCPIPDINPQTANSSPEVSQALQTYRQDARVAGAITFGMHAHGPHQLDLTREPVLQTGQRVAGYWAF